MTITVGGAGVANYTNTTAGSATGVVATGGVGGAGVSLQPTNTAGAFLKTLSGNFLTTLSGVYIWTDSTPAGTYILLETLDILNTETGDELITE